MGSLPTCDQSSGIWSECSALWMRVIHASDRMEESMSRPPLPPFTQETAIQKVRAAEDAWNTREPARVAQAYSEDSQWRNRVEFLPLV